jgi:hypothetical protein
VSAADWRGEFDRLAAAGDQAGCQDLITELAKSFPGLRDEVVGHVGKVAGEEWAQHCRVVFEEFSTKAKGKIFSLPPPQPRVDQAGAKIEGVLGGLPAAQREEVLKLIASLQAGAGLMAPIGFDQSNNPNGIAASLANAKRALKQLGVSCRYDVWLRDANRRERGEFG